MLFIGFEWIGGWQQGESARARRRRLQVEADSLEYPSSSSGDASDEEEEAVEAMEALEEEGEEAPAEVDDEAGATEGGAGAGADEAMVDGEGGGEEVGGEDGGVGGKKKRRRGKKGKGGGEGGEGGEKVAAEEMLRKKAFYVQVQRTPEMRAVNT